MSIKNKNLLISSKKNISAIVNKTVQINKGNDFYKKSNYIIDNNKKQILKRNLQIPNTKCQFKKINNNFPKKNRDPIKQKKIINKKINEIALRNQRNSLKKRNSNSQFSSSNTSAYITNEAINNTQKGKIISKPLKIAVAGEKMKLIPKSPRNIKKISNNNYYINSNSQNDYNNIAIKIISNSNKNNSKDYPLYITKIEKRRNILNNINNNNFNGNITYNNNVNFNFNNNKDNEIIYDLPKKIQFNKKDMDIIKGNFHLRTPSFDSPKIYTEVSPIKKNKFINSHNNPNESNKLIKIPFFQTDFSFKQKEFPDNYSYHEIIHLSAKKIPKNSNIKNKRNNHYSIKRTKNYIVELNNENYTINIMRNKHKQSLNNNNNILPISKIQNKNYSTIFANKSPQIKNINNGKYFNNIYLYENHSTKNNHTKNFIFSPKNQKIELSDGYMELENEEMNEIPQNIHYFGEEMLNRNKNYIFPKQEINNNMPVLNNTKKIKISLKKNNSYNDLNQIIDFGINTFKENCSPKKIDIKDKYKYISPNKNTSEKKRKDYNSCNKIQKINRYKHNIINRKKIKKFVMEKSLNEEFISNSNKKANKNGVLRDKISNYEASILDNDSINEIIMEFEKEIETEEKMEKNMKIINNNKNITNINNRNENKIINISNNDTLKYSFFSDNEFSFLSKDSTNNSKIKKNKKHYYKTKNVDMEKNYDFVIYGTKKNKNVKI